MFDFLKQRTTIQGIALLVGTAIGWWTGAVPLDAAAASISGALVMMGMTEGGR